MTIQKTAGRQEVQIASIVITAAMLVGNSGVDLEALDMPPGAIVLGGDVTVTEAFDSGTSDVLDVGDASSENRYVNDVNIAATGRTALVPTGFTITDGEPAISVRWTGVGAAPTAGSARLTVQYFVPKRIVSNYGLGL
jgi:hypothetical protein